MDGLGGISQGKLCSRVVNLKGVHRLDFFVNQKHCQNRILLLRMIVIGFSHTCRYSWIYHIQFYYFQTIWLLRKPLDQWIQLMKYHNSFYSML